MQVIPTILLTLSLFHAPALARTQYSSLPMKLTAIPGLQAYQARAQDGCNPDPGRCTVKDQSGSMEAWECRDSEGKIRCYADVEYENGTRMRVWGDGCYQTYSDCWSTGPGAVDPCY